MKRYNPSPREIPVATYRLQFNKNFTLRHAIKILPYLRKLGISHVYSSPLLKAKTGISHGYDTTSHRKLNPEIGDTKDLDQFAAKLKNLGMGLILDIVPNHMAADTDNEMWTDVLEFGTRSEFASYFDIDWEAGQGKLVLSILETSLEEAIRERKIRLDFQTPPALYLSINQTLFLPISPASFVRLLEAALGQTSVGPIRDSAFPRMRAAVHRFVQALGNPRTNGGEIKELERSIMRLALKDSSLCEAISQAIERTNADTLALRAFVALQNYNPLCWKDGLISLNYRRFFTVNSLVGFREEYRPAFEEAHSYLFRLIREKKIQGLRIDHPDGLWAPAQYFQKLQKQLRDRKKGNRLHYVLAEKILTDGEQLPRSWPIDGTTGYDFLNELNSLFVDEKCRTPLARLWREFVGSWESYERIAFRCRILIQEKFMQPDVLRIAKLALRAVPSQKRLANPGTEDELLSSLCTAIQTCAASFPVYRTYVTEHGSTTNEDRKNLAVALERTRGHLQGQAGMEWSLKVLQTLFASEGNLSAASECVMRFQQHCAAVMAKGIEDTAFYRYVLLASLNEVGGNPNEFRSSVEAFHEKNFLRFESWPHSMLATSTHDTKRSEDVRARINVLSEVPHLWASMVHRWSRLNAEFKRGRFPSRRDEYLLYMTLAGTLPLGIEQKTLHAARSEPAYVDRIVEYKDKASKEAKQETNWIEPNEEYGKALEHFVRSVLRSEPPHDFGNSMHEFLRKVDLVGRYNSVSQVLLKLTSPGVPDIYQGCESWDYHLVDPDNRRPVDFDRLEKTLDSLVKKEKNLPSNLLLHSQDGALKTFVIWRTLQFRWHKMELFSDGTYVPVTVVGKRRRNVCAFMRTFKDQKVIVVTARFFWGVTEGGTKLPVGWECWKDTRVLLPANQRTPPEKIRFRNVLTDELYRASTSQPRAREAYLSLEEIFRTLPFALISEEG